MWHPYDRSPPAGTRPSTSAATNTTPPSSAAAAGMAPVRRVSDTHPHVPPPPPPGYADHDPSQQHHAQAPSPYAPRTTTAHGSPPPPPPMHHAYASTPSSRPHYPPPPPMHDPYAAVHHAHHSYYASRSPYGPPPPRHGSYPYEQHQAPTAPRLPPEAHHQLLTAASSPEAHHRIQRHHQQQQQQHTPQPPSASPPGGCTCKKSKCLKLYCQCFSASSTCGPRCKCLECHNTSAHSSDIESARRVILERNPQAFRGGVGGNGLPARGEGCKCRRSFCLKKYCECFTRSKKCTGFCRCVNCQNRPLPVSIGGGGAGPYASPPMHVPVVQQQHPIAPKAQTAAQDQEDRLAIMAAVAMTELLGSGDARRKRPREQEAAVATPPQVKKAKDVPANDTTTAPPVTPEEKPKDSSPAQVSRTSSHGSDQRTPAALLSPDMVRTPAYRASPVAYPSPRASPTFGGYGSHHRQHHAPPPHHHHHAPPPPYASAASPYFKPRPPTPTSARSSPTPSSTSSTSTSSSTTGLPKALSFRKICSKCGKTRGEHGELGFGHRCVYQDCGKCGAGIQCHEQHHSPMGILCTLTESQGATPGAALAYMRKIQDLANRAALQQKVTKHQRQQQQQQTSTPEKGVPTEVRVPTAVAPRAGQ